MGGASIGVVINGLVQEHGCHPSVHNALLASGEGTEVQARVQQPLSISLWMGLCGQVRNSTGPACNIKSALSLRRGYRLTVAGIGGAPIKLGLITSGP